MNQELNYRHLYYFWVTAKEGGMSHAAARLGIAVQTVSAQVRLLEQSLGHALFKPAGRGLVLTEAGHAALELAEQIFHLGEQLHTAVSDAASQRRVRLVVGISDGLPKLAVRDLLAPALTEANLRLLCHEDSFDDLLAALALHRLDVVLSDRPAPANPNLRLYSHALGASALGWYAPGAWFSQARRGFPHSLAQVPVLLPTAQSSVRMRIDQWFERQGVQAHVVGEFEDSALLATFGASGMGVFPAAARMRESLAKGYGLKWVAPCEGVQEYFYAIGTARKVPHPLVQRLLSATVA
jgi:LysR family transcriptional activator of nhaA